MRDQPSVPTANLQTSTGSADGQNAGSAERLFHTDIRPVTYLVASIKMQMARMYLNDLRGFFGDDPGIFSRMVVDGGKSLPTAHPQGWAEHTRNALAYEHVETYFSSERDAILEQLGGWGL